MPIQTPQWTDFLICPICCNEYDYVHKPISLACSHTVCKLCLSKLQTKQCPFDQTSITIDINDLPVNYALLQLVSSNISSPSEKSVVQMKYKNNFNLSVENSHHYSKAIKSVEQVALYLKPFSSITNSSCVNVLSRPMQKKLVTLINCQLLEEEGRLRALKAARSLGERTVTELIIQHQNPQQLSTNLWAAVRARGCQFLGPAMQEEVLKLVLLALEDGSALSRKVLVMFVVQRLEPHFPQASKTSIGHVVQLLYRASCFVVSKREGDSSLMKLKEEFRTYDALRREHDAQIVEIATEAGLRIAPDQWSALLYGDTTHKSHMQSIIDKLQNPQSFPQSVQELIIALQRTGDPGNLCTLRSHLEYLADIDVNLNFGNNIWPTISIALEAACLVVSGLVNFIKTHGCWKTNTESNNSIAIHATKYKISLCRDLLVRGICPRGISCTFAHSEEELLKYRSKHRKNQRRDNEMMHLKFNNNNSISSKPTLHDNIEESDCRLCKPSEFLPNYNLAFLQPNSDFPQSGTLVSSPLSFSSSPKIISPQYLMAVNQRKQQFISELQQILLNVQNQYSTNNYNHPSNLYRSKNSVSDSSLVMNNKISISDLRRPDVHVHNDISKSSFASPALLNISPRINTDMISTESQILSSLDSSVNSLLRKENFLSNTICDWNINRSKLCHNCDVCNTTDLTITAENCHYLSQCNLSEDLPKSLLLESVKLQDQLKGLKKQITDIKDKTYEEGIINDLKALELRLECELEEEEEKLWPIQDIEKEKVVE